jgi:putative inorganic carbon (HCO3(-)) transporter
MKNRELIIATLFVLIAVITVSLALLSLPLALLASGAVTVGAIVFFKPFFGLLLYIILLYVRPQDFMPALEKMRIMLVLAVVIIFSFFTHNIFRKKAINLVSPRQSALMIVMLLIVPLSNLSNMQFMAAWEGFNEFLTVFLLFLIILNITDDARKLRTVCWTLVLCTFALSANGILQHFRGSDLIGNEPTANGRIRWIGIFGDPNDLALLINSFFPFVLMNLFDRSVSAPKKTALLVIGGANILALYYTNSRGGFIALFLIIAFFSYWRWGLLRGLAIGAVLLAAAVVISPSRMGELSPYEQSASGRVYAWIDGLVMLKSKPLLGIGFQNFAAIHGRAAHSAFIQCLAELGLIGYFAWLALLYTSIADVVRAGRRSATGEENRYADILLLSLIGSLGSAFFLSQAYSPVLYILLALSATTVKHAEIGPTRPRLLSSWETVRIAVLLGGSILVYKLLAIVYI